MKIKVDENLPLTLAHALAGLGHDVETVPNEGLQGAPDDEVWRIAQAENRFLITQDLHFADVRRFTPGTHCGVLLARINAPGRKALLERITSAFETEDTDAWAGCFVVVTEHKTRVRRPR